MVQVNGAAGCRLQYVSCVCFKNLRRRSAWGQLSKDPNDDESGDVCPPSFVVCAYAKAILAVTSAAAFKEAASADRDGGAAGAVVVWLSPKYFEATPATTERGG